MLDQIIQQLNNDLVTDVGLNSSYADDKVENIQRTIPKTISTDTFIGFRARNGEVGDFEIGQKQPRHLRYFIEVWVLVKDLDFDNGFNRLMKIFKRTIKSIANNTKVLTLEYSDNNIKEKPYQMSIARFDFDTDMWNESQMAHIAVITLEIKTEFTC